MSDREKTAALMERLRRHYINPADDLPGGIFLDEVGRNGQHGRRVDALYVGFTSASGRQLIGHEVKVSRSDWRRELEKVGKADTWADDCHAWYVVAPEGVVPANELPEGWGLLDDGGRTKTRLRTVVKAHHRADRVPSWDTVRSILARYDTLRALQIQAGRRDALQRAHQQAEALAANRSAEGLTSHQRHRLDVLDRLEDAIGWKVDDWAYGNQKDTTLGVNELAAAVRIVRAADGTGTSALDYAAEQLQHALAALGEAKGGLDELAELRSRR